MRLYDTATGSIHPLIVDGAVHIYICGITPYAATHLGHAATYVNFDVLHRRLVDRGHDVRMVRNITDIDDDLLERARRDEINYLDLAFGEKKRFDDDLASLGVMPAWSEPRATSAIPEIRGSIAALLKSGAAYAAEGSVFFDHKASERFGEISGSSRVDMRTIGESRGERPRAPGKHHPLDTILWQPSLSDEPSWEAPWGSGRPGWHIECTALSRRELGEVHIQGGGCDLVYPHHEFCNAQLDALDGEPPSHWMHQSCVHLEGEPMSKSTGNLIFVEDILREYEPMALRLAVLAKHYRSKTWEWTTDLVEHAAIRLDTWRACGQGSGPLAEVRAALDDDLNIPQAIASIDAAAEAGVGVSKAAGLLGVKL